MHLWVILKSFKRWGFYKSLSNDISASKIRRDILEPSLEPPSIALNTLFSQKVFAHIRHTLLSIFKVSDNFDEKSTKYFFFKNWSSLKQIFCLSRGTPYPKCCRLTFQLSNETRFVYLSCLHQKLWPKTDPVTYMHSATHIFVVRVEHC